MSLARSTISIRISGRVQGVWFRASTKNEALRLSLTGFVKNEPDGGVYVEVTGEQEVLDLFVQWCQQGPELARVKSAEVVKLPYAKFDGFEIRRN